MEQTSLLDPAPPAPSGRRSSKRIGVGDIVEVDRKGRRFHAIVDAVEQADAGRTHVFELTPLDGRTTYRSATIREVVGVWRRVSRQAPAAAPGA